MKNSCLQFRGFKIDNVTYQLNNKDLGSDSSRKNEEQRLKLDIEKKITQINETEIKAILVVKIGEKDDNSPLYIEVSAYGIFHFEEDDDLDEATIKAIKEENTIAILFPYVRAFISNLTVGANIPVIVLPIINVNKLTKENND